MALNVEISSGKKVLAVDISEMKKFIDSECNRRGKSGIVKDFVHPANYQNTIYSEHADYLYDNISSINNNLMRNYSRPAAGDKIEANLFSKIVESIKYLNNCGGGYNNSNHGCSGGCTGFCTSCSGTCYGSCTGCSGGCSGGCGHSCTNGDHCGGCDTSLKNVLSDDGMFMVY